MEFVEQPFFAETEYAYVQNTDEVFLRLEKASPAYATDPKIGATVTAIIQDFVSKDSSRIVFFTCVQVMGGNLLAFENFLSRFSSFRPVDLASMMNG